MDSNFQIIYKNTEVPVEVIRTGGKALYVVKFSDMTPLVVSRAKRFEGPMFWTSIPEGRQELAEAIGILIDAYLKTVQS